MFSAGLGLVGFGRAAPRAQQLLCSLFPARRSAQPGEGGRVVVQARKMASTSGADGAIDLTELLSACVDLGVKAGHEIR